MKNHVSASLHKMLLQYAGLGAEDRRYFNTAINEFLLASSSVRRRLVEQWQLVPQHSNESARQDRE
jgi:hypothetical protein